MIAFNQIGRMFSGLRSATESHATDARLAFSRNVILALAAMLVVVWVAVPREPFHGVAGYLPFHMFAETFSIVVSIIIFGIMWNAYSAERPAGLIVLSCAMLAVGLLDFGHMLSISRMPDFVTPSSPDKGITFWLAARMVATAGIVFAALWPETPLHRATSRYVVLAVFLAITASVYWIGLFHPTWLPRFFVPGTGLTPVKIAAEYLVVAALAVPAFVFYRRARRSHATTDIALFMAIAISILSELYFAIYVAAHDLFQVFGHVYKVIAYFFIYRAVFVYSVREPYIELQQARAELEQRVHKRTAQLETANQDLESFSYSVSHDLRTPLRAIDGFSRILLETYADKLDDEGRRLLTVVRDNTQKMGQMINDILAFSRAGRTVISVSEINMNELATEIFDELKPAAAGRAVNVQIHPLPPACADPAMMRQVLTNLLSNAIKFTRTKGIANIEVSGHAASKGNIYLVKDNGVGFDPQYTHKLFGVFQRLHGEEEFEGTGIGLAIIKRIIDKHGGRVWAEAKPGEGAAFYFSLPSHKPGATTEGFP